MIFSINFRIQSILSYAGCQSRARRASCQLRSKLHSKSRCSSSNTYLLLALVPTASAAVIEGNPTHRCRNLLLLDAATKPARKSTPRLGEDLVEIIAAADTSFTTRIFDAMSVSPIPVEAAPTTTFRDAEYTRTYNHLHPKCAAPSDHKENSSCILLPPPATSVRSNNKMPLLKPLNDNQILNKL